MHKLQPGFAAKRSAEVRREKPLSSDSGQLQNSSDATLRSRACRVVTRVGPLTPYARLLILFAVRSRQNHIIGLITAGMLAGCSAQGAALLSLAIPPPVPVPGSGKTTEFPAGYSLGPNAHEDLSESISEAISADEGSVYFAGRVYWTGMERFETDYEPDNAVNAAITDRHVLFIWWSENDQGYVALFTLPFEEIYAVDLRNNGIRASIRLCHENHPIFLDEESIFFGDETQLSVLKSTNRRDNKKTEEVFWLLDQLINRGQETSRPQPPCD